MSSTNKTSLGLNMWEASDKPVRQDFVNDNVIINEKITKLNSDFNLKVNSSNFNVSRDQFTKSIPDNTATEICHYTSTADTLIVLSGWITTPGNSTGVRQVRIDANGATRFMSGTTAGLNVVGFSLLMVLTAGSTISIFATQSSGSNLSTSVYANSNVTFVAS